MAFVAVKYFRDFSFEHWLFVGSHQPETVLICEVIATTTYSVTFKEWHGSELLKTGTWWRQWFSCSGSTTSSHLKRTKKVILVRPHRKTWLDKQILAEIVGQYYWISSKCDMLLRSKKSCQGKPISNVFQTANASALCKTYYFPILSNEMHEGNFR